jgi:hypothetical protein
MTNEDKHYRFWHKANLLQLPVRLALTAGEVDPYLSSAVTGRGDQVK